MKNLYALIIALLLYGAINAQTITVNGACIAGPVTLTQGTNPALIDGKPYYVGTGTVAGNTGVQIAIEWDNTENLWLFTLDGGYVMFTSSAATQQPPGTASTVFDWDPLEAAPCASPAPLSVTGNVALWVTFGTIDAHIKGSNLHVNWTTEKEVNNDHFEIEGSTDGEQFVTIGTLKSKAENGNSDITLNYEWTGSAGMSLSVLPYLAFVLILLLFVCRKKTMVLATVAISFVAFIQVSCKKDKDSIANSENYYIRIAQIDKDGTKTYSKVVRVNGE
ncbi:hypothetical protein ACLOAU_07555 [Niabella sp. CJ426]|uniref:hypothetical protein n=1 Tax=Niabella sp. CJ426 TaxID=3393740 RepID=UPI003D080300